MQLIINSGKNGMSISFDGICPFKIKLEKNLKNKIALKKTTCKFIIEFKHHRFDQSQESKQTVLGTIHNSYLLETDGPQDLS